MSVIRNSYPGLNKTWHTHTHAQRLQHVQVHTYPDRHKVMNAHIHACTCLQLPKNFMK